MPKSFKKRLKWALFGGPITSKEAKSIFKALDKATPQKPIVCSFDRFKETCPNCKSDVYIHLEDGSCYYLDYCQDCGQAIDRSEE
jgi:hypothetical protein